MQTIEQQIKDHENTIRILKNLSSIVEEVVVSGQRRAKMVVECYTFLQGNIKQLEAKMATLDTPTPAPKHTRKPRVAAL